MFLKRAKIALLSTFIVAFQAPAIPDLPEPVTNNAVANVVIGEDEYLVSFMGLGAGKSYVDTHAKVWSYKKGDLDWQSRADVPSSLPLKGRLAASAIGIKNQAFVFGGYTVAKDHSEVSSPDNFSFDPHTGQYRSIAAMPVPTDDAVALGYADRYIYLISGWHNDGNVNLVQVYDIESDSWQQASPFPGKPVFGHAGGIVGRTILICDGVAVEVKSVGKREFVAEPACYRGEIDSQNQYKITWHKVAHPTGKARYRMAATGYQQHNAIVFAGGSLNPYNYNGIGYNGEPSEPDDNLWVFDIATQAWRLNSSGQHTMDHRGLVLFNNKLVVIGGMTNNQHVIKRVTEYNFNKENHE